MTAVCTLEYFIGRAVGNSASLGKQQKLEFQKMHEQVLSQPYTQGVFDRYVYDGDEEEEEPLVQSISFSAFMSSIGMWECVCGCLYSVCFGKRVSGLSSPILTYLSDFVTTRAIIVIAGQMGIVSLVPSLLLFR